VAARTGVLAATESSLGLGLPAVAGVLTAMEAGVPIPVPSDLVVLVLGERASAGRVPVLAAVIVLEAVAVAGTALLFFAARGPGQAVLARYGPRVGLTAARLNRASAVVRRRGPTALVVGRGTPGLRTVTVVAAGGSGLTLRRALPPLVLGSSIFLQLHHVLGYVLGPAAREALERAKGPVIVVLVLVAAAGVVFWLRRRGRRAGAQAATEACCPACLALGTVAPKVFGIAGLAPAGAEDAPDGGSSRSS
jgi:membrane-associated protein